MIADGQLPGNTAARGNVRGKLDIEFERREAQAAHQTADKHGRHHCRENQKQQIVGAYNRRKRYE